MSLTRILILGILALLILMFVAQAVAVMVPFVIGAFSIWILFIWLQKTLSAKDKVEEAKRFTPHRFQTMHYKDKTKV